MKNNGLKILFYYLNDNIQQILKRKSSHLSFLFDTLHLFRGKLIVVGDWGVGKTAIVQQFLTNGTGFPKVSKYF